MPHRPRSATWANWRRALLASVAVHGVALIAIVSGASRRVETGAGGEVQPLLAWPADIVEIPTMIDLAAMDIVPSPPPPEVEAVSAPVVAIPVSGPPGDSTNAVPEPRRRDLDGAPDGRPPAPDRGKGEGRPLADRAWRRDASTLHERLTDGAEVNQASHARTARKAASPQAVRREPRTGVGDSARNLREEPAPRPATYEVADPAAPGSGGETVAGIGAVASDQEVAAPAEPSDSDMAQVAQGPLDSDQGTRSFDVATRGRTASDDHAVRAASNEPRPSITDLTLAAVSGNSREGRGPSDMPGAVSSPGKGRAASPPGVRSTSDGAGEEVRTRERLYNRYTHEIGARVNQALVWPRKLAIRLEQGQTILRFVVLPDGKLSENVRVVKSSGFTEFDQAALDAVRKALPFPPMRDPAGARPLPVNLPVTFSNPVIR